MRRRAGLAAALLALLAWPAGAPAQAPPELTVYSSLPLRGPSAPITRDVVRGAKLALEQAGGAAGGVPVRYVSLNDATTRAGTWTPELAARNARRAAADPSAIGYLGAFNSGASANAIPILNRAGILQVSPSNTAVGLTRGGPGADRGEPGRYYPAGTRTYGRVIPADHVQGAAGAEQLRLARVRRVLVVHDGEVYGRGVARDLAAQARRRGIQVVSVRRFSGGPRSAAALGRLARRSGAQAVFYGGITANGAVRLFRALHRANRRLRLYGSDGVAESGFTERIGRSVAARTRVLVATLQPEAYPVAGRRVLRDLRRSYRRSLDVYALYGYEAMSVVLDSVNRGGPTRLGSVAAFFATRDRDSVLGRYSIDPNGDTTLRSYGSYRVTRGGELRYERRLRATLR